jgi:glycosyltransferase involved in cell wall biosynthesis
VVLLLVGGGPETGRLKAESEKLGLDDAVRFIARVPHAEVRRYYDLVDFFVYPRRSMRLTELVTPLKPLEAMAEGRIVIASAVGGHRELIRDEETGFLFPPDAPETMAHQIIKAISASDVHPHMRESARHFVETSRTWPVCAAAYRPIYEAALHRPP